MPDEHFVTKIECARITLAAEAQTAMVLKALVGEDLRGGIVKDVADTKKDISEIKTAMKNDVLIGLGNNGHNGGLGKREKAIVYSALITSVGSTSGIIIIEALKFFH